METTLWLSYTCQTIGTLCCGSTELLLPLSGCIILSCWSAKHFSGLLQDYFKIKIQFLASVIEAKTPQKQNWCCSYDTRKQRVSFSLWPNRLKASSVSMISDWSMKRDQWIVRHSTPHRPKDSRLCFLLMATVVAKRSLFACCPFILKKTILQGDIQDELKPWSALSCWSYDWPLTHFFQRGWLDFWLFQCCCNLKRGIWFLSPPCMLMLCIFSIPHRKAVPLATPSCTPILPQYPPTLLSSLQQTEIMRGGRETIKAFTP